MYSSSKFGSLNNPTGAVGLEAMLSKNCFGDHGGVRGSNKDGERVAIICPS
jgi:hypothetical protein